MNRLSGRNRKMVLLAHIVSAAAWFGLDLALGILVVVSLVASPRTAGMAIQAVDLFAIWPMFVASLVCLISGAILSVTSKYGLVRYWWVAIKLAFNVIMSVLILFSLRPGVAEAARIGERMLAGDSSVSVSAHMLGPVVVAPTMLLISYVLSVFKPLGRVRKQAVVPRPRHAELAKSN
ncbi:membrane protein [Lentzea sp. NBRC 105346]|uniref:hypothetical protein n=1 Tax=Lentzea sp. NBRC 105346 TaxID=3032205 RepID=UPI0024A210ED|nr:hypothetical protein [Lentzea sp. NBRC 105346]GLZ31818.1 membrane protein [Lentzea sp. NBRC 105346]